MASQAVITEIATERRAESVQVVVHATAPLPYTAFTLHDPPQLVLEFMGARLGEGAVPSPLVVADGLVSRIEPQEFPETRQVRVFVHLRRMATHTIEVHGPQLQVTLREPPAPVARDDAPATPPAAAARPEVPPLQETTGTVPEPMAGQTLVTAVTYTTLPEQTLVRVQTVGEPPRVRVKQHQDPMLLSLDMEQARLSPQQEQVIPIPGSGSVLTQLTVLQPEEETASVRVMAHLQAPMPFEVRQEGNAVQLVIAHPSAAAATVAPPSLPPQPEIMVQPQTLSSAPRLLPAQLTPGPGAPLAGRRLAPTVKTPAAVPMSPQALPSGRLLTPVQATVPAPGTPGAPGEGPRYTGERISLDFQNADINDILRLIAEVSGLNIIAGGDVQGTVTTRMVDVPWDQALDVILKINGLAQEREGNIIRVAPLGRFVAERQESLKARQAENQAEPTTTQVVPVNYASVTELQKNLEKLKSDRGLIDLDARTNTMILTDVRKNLDDMLALVERLDRQTPQVMIEGRIVEASRNFTQELGIRFGGQYTAVTDRTFPNRIGIAGAASETPPGNFLVDLPAAVGAGSGGAIGFALAGASSLLNVELSALERSGQGKTISNPRIATLDNVEAQIQSGVRIPFVTTSAEGTKTELVDASLILKVTPHVTPDGFINLKINVTNNQPNPQLTSGGQPSISTREANTAMLVRDGDTVVIGGLYRRTFSTSRDGVPWLSNVPVLGWLFRNTEEIDNNEELLIFITPRIIRQPEEPGRARASRTY
jgi:type IV pilus assembly protein PilQ